MKTNFTNEATVFLSLDRQALAKTEKKAIQNHNEAGGSASKDEENKELYYPDVEFLVKDNELDKNMLTLSGDLIFEGTKIGWLMVEQELSSALVSRIFEEYAKRINKARAVLEASED